MLVPNLMTKIVNQTNRGKPVIKDSKQLDVMETTFEVSKLDDDKSSFKGIDLDEIDNIGGSSQVQCYLSQKNEENDNYVEKISTQRNTYYKEALPLFEEMINSYPNKYIFDEMCQLTRNRHMIHISSRGINNQLSNSRITLFGENKTNKRSMERHKFIHDK